MTSWESEQHIRAAQTGRRRGVRRIAFCLVIGPSGQLVRLEDLGANTPGALVRGAPRVSRELAANFLYGHTRFALGLRPDSRSGSGAKVDFKAFECFRNLHLEALADTPDLPLQAFLKFLDRWSPADFGEFPSLVERAGQLMAFRFQYDDELLHERHKAQLARARYTNSVKPAVQGRPADEDRSPYATVRQGDQ
jgi:CRISPR-associated protein Csd1